MSRYELPVCTPESVGIPSSAVQRFLEKLEEKRLPMHSVLMQRHGKMLFETYWKPYDQDRKHRMYSTSKSFVSTAIGMLAGEGKLSLDDKAVSFFPEYITEDLSPYTAETTVRDLLMMAQPFARDAYAYSDQDPDWTLRFFQTKADHKPGKLFLYNTLSTVMLCMIVKRVSGEEFTDYLRTRFFEPAGMNTDIWTIKSPCGHDWGGSALHCTSRDLMKFAMVYMGEGFFNGKQIVPAGYARDAVSPLIDNSMTASNHTEEWGYGYKFWRHQYGWSCRGMGSQLAIAFPAYDFILVTTADTQALSGGDRIIFESAYEELLPYLQKDAALPEDAEAAAALQAYTGKVCRELICTEGEKTSSFADAVNGRTYRMDENKMQLKWMRFRFEGDEGVWEYENATGVHAIRFGLGHQVEGVFPETHYYGKKIGEPLGRGYEIHTSAGWIRDDNLKLTVYATDYFIGTLRINFSFDGDIVTAYATKNAEWFFQEYQGFATGTAQ
ncbi:MAG: serine hydrolase [Clostridia bacterium]|nr:serine hydrolase [Clostridia bacterium]